METTIEASQLLRPGLLEGVSVLLAGPAAASAADLAVAPAGVAEANESLGGAVGAACAELGARIAVWGLGGEIGDVDVLVVDGAGMLARGGTAAAGGSGGSGGAAAAPTMPRHALRACVEDAWEVTREVVNAAWLSAGRAGRIVYLAPAPDAGPYADAARAGLENLARTLSIEWARHAVTAVVLAPGSAAARPSGGAGEVASLVAYLASPAGAYFSGCLLELRGPAGRDT